MKTAMQELIGWINENDKYDAPIEGFDIVIKAIKLLEKEKEQIQNVFEHCWNHPNWKGEYDIKDMNDYLKNYNQNK
jgi:hypothetical protein